MSRMRFVLSLLILLMGVSGLPHLSSAEGVNDAAVFAAKPAKLLSAYRLFADPAVMTPNDGVVPYDLNTPLFTDYAVKRRFVYVPDGASAEYHETEAFDFPVGTVLVKSFGYPADFSKPDQDIQFIETRLLIHQQEGWVALPYVWNDDMSDATLKVAGKRVDKQIALADGTVKSISYAVPNKNQCKGCHALDDAVIPLGPKARHLNKDFAYPSGMANQLQHWSDAGLLSGAPDAASAPAMAVWNDPTSGSLEERARAYLDVNCGHCHRPRGPADNSGLFLSALEEDRIALGIWKRPVAAGQGTGGRNFDIAPGDPSDSILLFRMETTEPGVLMPELGRSLQHDEGVALIGAWIESLPVTDQPQWQ